MERDDKREAAVIIAGTARHLGWCDPDLVIGRGEILYVDPSEPDDRVNEAVQHLEELRIERIKGAAPNPMGNRRQRRAAAAKERRR